jgi:hypothetical protein
MGQLTTVLPQSASAQLLLPAVEVNKNTPPAQIPKLPWRDYVGMSFRYKQYRLNDVELGEYKKLSSLETLSRDQAALLVFLDRKVSIAQGDSGETVYIIRGGDEYHRISCPELGKLPDNYLWTGYGYVKIADDYSFPIPLNRARLAFNPCPKCDPPQ